MNKQKLEILESMNQRQYTEDDLPRNYNFCQGAIDEKTFFIMDLDFKPGQEQVKAVKQIYSVSRPAKPKLRSAKRVKGWISPELRNY